MRRCAPDRAARSLIGCAVGARGVGRLADKFGRKPVMIVTAALFAATAVWCAYAGSAAMFTLARFVSGIAVGAASVFYDGDVLWQSVGFTATDSLRNNVVPGVIHIAATLV